MTLSDVPQATAVDSEPGHLEIVHGAHGGVGTTRMRRLTRHPDATFAVLDWEFPAGTSEGPHHHRDEPIGVEQYLVLSGAVTVIVDGTAHPLGAGDSIAVARPAVRELRNDSSGPARVLLVYERPALREERDRPERAAETAVSS